MLLILNDLGNLVQQICPTSLTHALLYEFGKTTIKTLYSWQAFIIFLISGRNSLERTYGVIISSAVLSIGLTQMRPTCLTERGS